MGDPGLAASLTEAGIEATETSDLGEDSDADAAAVIRLTPLMALRSAIPPRPPGARLVLVAGGGRPMVRDNVSRLRRAAELGVALLTGAVFGLLLRRMAKRLRARGWTVEAFGMGDRSRSTYRLHYGPRRHEPLAGWALATTAGELEPSATELALERAAEGLGTELRAVRVTVVETGKLLIVALGSDRRKYMVRLAAAPGRKLLANGLVALDRISAPDADPVVSRHAVVPLVRGEIGALLFSAEPLMPGAPPRAMNPALWQDCIGFLAGLRRIATSPGTGRADFAAAAELIADFVRPPQDRLWLVELGHRLDRRFEGVPRGWEHGDFWLDNIMVESGRLSSVLDWDTARPEALPLLDMFDLISLSVPGHESWTPGQRLIATVWPLVADRTDARMLRYCEAIGLEVDPGLLRDLARAHWFTRVARDLDEVPDRRHRPGWLAANVTDPVRFLRAVEKPGTGSAGARLIR